METTNDHIVWLQELSKDDPMVAGKKCCHLGEMLKAEMQVPPGFALTLKAYETFMKESGAEKEILQLVENNKHDLQKDMNKCEEMSSYIINEVIMSKKMPDSLSDDILRYYEQLCEQCGVPDVPVATRSSGPVSMPGQFDTYLNVCGEEELIRRIMMVWASSFNSRAIAYRLQRGMVLQESPIGVAVLKMVNARSSGVMFTLDPINGDLSRIFIEGSWGLGESLVSGQVTPDKYIVDKITLDISQKTICKKAMELVYGPEGDVIPRDISPEKQEAPCLSDEEIKELAKIGKKIEKHYGVPQDVEWAVDEDLDFPENIIILQARPETIWSKKKSKPVMESKGNATEKIARGLIQGIKF